MFSAYFVFQYLNMFCVEIQVLELFATQLATHQSQNPNREFIQKLWRLTHKNFHDWTSQLAQSRNAQK